MLTHDPVCGKRINRKKAHGVVGFGGDSYYLCSPVCNAIFLQDPSRHVSDRLGNDGGTKPLLEWPAARITTLLRLRRALSIGSGAGELTR